MLSFADFGDSLRDLLGITSGDFTGGGGSSSFSSSQYLSITPNIGWHQGEPINNYTLFGSTPSWSTIRYRFWSNEYYYNREAYPESSWHRLEIGKGPISMDDNATMQLHHPDGREGDNIFHFDVVTLTEHREIHYGR